MHMYGPYVEPLVPLACRCIRIRSRNCTGTPGEVPKGRFEARGVGAGEFRHGGRIACPRMGGELDLGDMGHAVLDGPE